MSTEQMRAALLKVYPGSEKIEGLRGYEVLAMYTKLVNSGRIPA